MQPRNERGRFVSVAKTVMVPVWYGLLTAAVALIAQLVSLSPLGFGVLIGLVLTAALTGLVVWGTAHKLGWRSRSRKAAMGAVVAAWAWSSLFVLLPLAAWIWPLITAWLVLLGVHGWSWWAPRRLPYTAPAPDPEPQPTTLPDPEPEPEGGWTAKIQSDWDEYIDTNNGALPGTKIVPVEEKEHTAIFDMDFVRGRQALAHAINNTVLIASGLNVGEDKLIFERHPVDGSASRGRMTVITGTPLGGTVLYPGPQLNRATGEIHVGPFADAEGVCTWRAFTDNSFHGGHVCGVKGSGKSRVVDVIVHSLIADGRTVAWYGDPQKGASSAALSAHADWVARDLAGIKQMLASAIKVMEYREMENAVDGLDGFTPSRERPALLVIIDENATACRDKDIKAMEMAIAERGRKTGVALLTISQQLDLGAFGSEESLRNNIIGGNLLMLRTTTRTTKDLIGGLAAGIDPSKLPAIPGYGYRHAPEGEDGRPIGRSAPFRAYHLGDAKGASKDWFDKIPLTARAQLDDGAAAEAGKAYADRHASAERDLARMREIVERRRRGLLDDPFGAETGVINPAPTRTPIDDNPAFTVPVFGGDVAPTATGAATAVAAVDPITALDEASRTVYEQLCLGAWRPADICDATGYGDSWVDTKLKALIGSDLVAKVGFGHYHALGHESACRHTQCRAS